MLIIINIVIQGRAGRRDGHRRWPSDSSPFGRGDDTGGDPHGAQISQFELFELILLIFDKQLPVEQFETAVSQSAVPSPPLIKKLSPWMSSK